MLTMIAVWTADTGDTGDSTRTVGVGPAVASKTVLINRISSRTKGLQRQLKAANSPPTPNNHEKVAVEIPPTN